MFVPLKFKHKKQQKGKSFSKVYSHDSLSPNLIGLKAVECGRVSSKQLKTLKQTINKIIKKTGQLIIKVFPQTPISKKPLEIRMGKGKGAVDHWVCKIKTGMILCFIISNNKMFSKKALKYAQIKLPIKTKIIF